MGILDAALVSHKDPEALFMLATCQAYTGDDRALSSLTQAVENGYRVPAALKTNPWLAELRQEGRLDLMVRNRSGMRSCRGSAEMDLLCRS
jgi:hypothetical protein